MQSRQNITISQKHNFSQATLAVIEDTNRLNIVIDDIKADRVINIEFLIFFSIYDIFKHINKKRKQVIQQLSQIDNYEQRKVLNDELEKLDEEEKQYRINILLTANSFSTIKHNEILQEVADLFFEGHIQKASEKLNVQDMEGIQAQMFELLETEIKLEKVRDCLEDNANEFKIKAQLTLLNLAISEFEDRFRKVIFYFERGKISIEKTKRQSSIADYYVEFSVFYQNHNQYNEAQNLAQNALSIYEKDIYHRYIPNIAMIMNNLAVLYKDKHEFDLSEDMYKKCLYYYKELSSSNPDYLYNLCVLWNNFGEFYRFIDNESAKSAENCYLEALNIAKQCKNWNNVANVNNNLASLYSDIKRFKDAERVFSENLNYYKTKQVNTEDKADIFMTLNNLAIVCQNQNKIYEARKLYDEALSLRNELLNVNSRKYKVEYAKLYISLANLHLAEREFDNAEKYYLNSLEIFNSIEYIAPYSYGLEIAGIFNNLAVLNYSNSNIEVSKKYYNSSLEKYTSLLSNNSDTVKPYIVGLYKNIGFINQQQGLLEKSEECYNEALLVYADLLKKSNELYEADYASILVLVSILNLQMNRTKQSTSNALKALNILIPKYEKNEEYEWYFNTAKKVLIDNGVDINQVKK